MSSYIKVLDSSTAMKIAAGEVIERPASAIRELLDNSLDAEASWINIEIEKGGKEYISVQDNGIGMSPEDIQKSYLNHATSKIQKFDDLMQLTTFGFRGEALASLAEISKLTIASKSIDQEFGSELIVKFGQQSELLPKAMNQGTKIIITEFFQNVPARLKFLGIDTSEYRAILQEVLKKALTKPQVIFELSHNGERKYQLNACHELYDRIIDIFPELKNVLNSFIYEEQGIKVYGFLSKPSWYKPTRSYQYLFVNGRVIEWQSFKQQITIAYNNLLPPSRFPAVFCYIDIDTDKIDFNVHPQKKEIRFDNERLVSDIVRRAIRIGVEQSGFIVDTTQKETMIQSKTMSVPYNQSTSQSDRSSFSTSYDGGEFQKKSINKHNSKDHLFSIPQQNQLQELFIRSQSVESITTNLYDIVSKACYIGMIFKTYLIFEHNNCLYLVDFHAMHERIRYEKILSQHSSIDSQTIIPIVFELAQHEADIFEHIENELIKLGFQISRLSKTGFSIEAIPSILDINKVDVVVRELFIENLSIQDSYIWDSICKMIACKGSSRSGDNLSHEEIDFLIKEWGQCINPQSCPHGRPIVIPMNKLFFDKEFKRTGF